MPGNGSSTADARDPEFPASEPDYVLEELKDVGRVLTSGHMYLCAQTQVDREGREVGAELLIRWHHPKLGLIPTGRLIAMAEEVGAIHALGAWVLGQACKAIAKLDAAGSKARLTVNVSAMQFSRAEFVAGVLKELERSGAPAGRLVLEVTQSSTLTGDETSMVAARMKELSDAGIRICLDNFGSGFAGIASLRHYPYSEVKFYQGFTRALSTEEEQGRMVNALVNIARSLKIPAVASGIERADQAELVKKAGCEILQGYFIARPVPLEDWMGVRIRGLTQYRSEPQSL